MTKKFNAQLIKHLYDLAPSIPFAVTEMRRSSLVNELFQLAPEKPFTLVSGIELVKKIIIPSSPNLKENGTERSNFKK